jgi:hypothetical protein
MTAQTQTAPTLDHFDRMKIRLGERLAEVGQELAEANAALVSATIACEADATAENTKALAAAEKRVEKLQMEQRRLEMTAGGIDERIEAAREQADLERRKAAGAEFVAAMDDEQGHSQRVVALLDEAAEEMDKARAASKRARRAAGAAFGRGVVVDLLPAPLAFASYAEDVITRHGRSRDLQAFTDSVRGPWRPGRGPWAERLAELDL